MTLILTLGCPDFVVQASDRRLTSNRRVEDEESNKAGVLQCANARLAFGFTGLARYEGFDTRRWLLDALGDAGPPDYSAKGILDRLADRASRTFKLAPLRNVALRHKRLSIIFSGYLYAHNPPQVAFAIITNYQDFKSRKDSPEAWEHFVPTYWWERRPRQGKVALVQRVGTWEAMTADDIVQLRSLLEDQKPREAIIGKAVDVIRRMADRPAAQGNIGKQISTICLPADYQQPAESGYHSESTGYVAYLPDYVLAAADNRGVIFRDALARKVGGSMDTPMVIPKVRRNVPCPCGSGRKYKFCHGNVRGRPPHQPLLDASTSQHLS